MTREEIINFISKNYTLIDKMDLFIDIFCEMMDDINLNEIIPMSEETINKLDAIYCLLNQVKKDVSK